MEQWKPTKYNGFEISNHGRVRSAQGRIVKVQPKHTVNVSLGYRGAQRKCSVPKMMYEAFVGEVGENYVIVKGDLLRLENLELCSKRSRLRPQVTSKTENEIQMESKKLASLLSMRWASDITYSNWAGGW